MRDIARRYAIDGIHLDYARYPSDRFDYSRGAIRQFRTSVRPRSRATRPAARSTREEAVDLFAYPDALPDEWRSFRVARMTALVRRLAAAVKSERPGRTVTAAAAPDAQEALEHRLQDWGGWLNAGSHRRDLPDGLHDRAGAICRADCRRARPPPAHAVWAGIGAYRLSPRETIDNIQTARRLGASRRDPVFVRQPDQPAPGVPRLPVPGRTRRVRRSARSALPDRADDRNAADTRWSSPGSTTSSSPVTCWRSRRSDPGSRDSRRPPATTS